MEFEQRDRNYTETEETPVLATYTKNALDLGIGIALLRTPRPRAIDRSVSRRGDERQLQFFQTHRAVFIYNRRDGRRRLQTNK